LAGFEGVGPFGVRGHRGGSNDNKVSLSHKLHGKVLSHCVYLEVISIIYVYCLYYSHEYEIYYFQRNLPTLFDLDSGKSTKMEGLTLMDSDFSDGFSPNLPIDGSSWA